MSKDGKYIVSAGHWDNSFKIIAIDSGKVIQSVHKHDDIVSCLDIDVQERYLITGSKDTTCMLWEIVYQGNNIFSIDEKPLHRLHGHDKEVSSVSVNSEQDLIVTGSLDGTCIIFNILQGRLVVTSAGLCAFFFCPGSYCSFCYFSFSYVRTITPSLPKNITVGQCDAQVKNVAVADGGTLVVYLSYESNFSTVSPTTFEDWFRVEIEH